MLRPKSHHVILVVIALMTIPLWASLFFAHKQQGGFGYFDFFDYVRSAYALGLSHPVILETVRVGIVGAILAGALLIYIFEGAIFGVHTTENHGSAKWGTKHQVKSYG